MASLVLYLLVVFIIAQGHGIAVRSYYNAMFNVHRNRLCKVNHVIKEQFYKGIARK